MVEVFHPDNIRLSETLVSVKQWLITKTSPIDKWQPHLKSLSSCNQILLAQTIEIANLTTPHAASSSAMRTKSLIWREWYLGWAEASGASDIARRPWLEVILLTGPEISAGISFEMLPYLVNSKIHLNLQIPARYGRSYIKCLNWFSFFSYVTSSSTCN